MNITKEEYDIAIESLDMALKAGADAAKVFLDKSQDSTFTVLDGEFDSLAHCSDRSLYFHIFADGRYGNFSTNRFERDEISSLLKNAVGTVRMLSPDDARRLPDPSLYYVSADLPGDIRYGCLDGSALGLSDPCFEDVGPDRKRDIALECASVLGRDVLSSEIGFSDSKSGTFLADTQGFCGMTEETLYTITSDITLKGRGAARSNAYWYDMSKDLSGLRYMDCASVAYERAKMKLSPKKVRTGKFNMVVENSVASRLVAPILSALSGMSIYQKNSFLLDSLGRKIFPEWFTINDRPAEYGALGARLFDSEGVATRDMDVISEGCVMTYMIDSYASCKLGMPQTVESCSRPGVLSFDRSGTVCNDGESCLSLAAILRKMDNGIFVTGFNGGNTNPATGAFSFGIEGFLFRNGQIAYPVKEMLVTGDVVSLFSRSVIAGDDPFRATRWRIPTLAFEDVDFNG